MAKTTAPTQPPEAQHEAAEHSSESGNALPQSMAGDLREGHVAMSDLASQAHRLAERGDSDLSARATPRRPEERGIGRPRPSGDDLARIASELTEDEFAALLAHREQATGKRLGKRATGKYVVKSAIKIIAPGSDTKKRYEKGAIVELTETDAKAMMELDHVEPEYA